MWFFKRKSTTTIDEIAKLLARSALDVVSEGDLLPYRSLMENPDAEFTISQRTEFLILEMFSTMRAVQSMPPDRLDGGALMDAFHAWVAKEWATGVGGVEPFQRTVNERYQAYHQSMTLTPALMAQTLGETFAKAVTGRNVGVQDLALTIAAVELLSLGIKARTEVLESLLSTHTVTG
jgi:hypothetical protein